MTMQGGDFTHDTVLLHETVNSVFVGSGAYVDGTFGRGGHSRLLLDRLDGSSRLLAFDKDPQAIEYAAELASADARVEVLNKGFAELQQVAEERDLLGKVSGIMLDLGVSSPQLDDATRGFSFRQDGPLDMRMNPEKGVSAGVWINGAPEQEIADVLYRFGDEKFSRRIAKAIVASRKNARLETTLELANVIKAAHPKWDHKKHPATKSFQAIRIFINGELNELEAVLNASVNLLKPGGRLAVISFHSLEDRMVKQFIKRQEKGPDLPPDLPIRSSDLALTMKSVGKAVKAGKAEVETNVRSRSAVLRVAERLP